jgi:biotin carboxyl carrier protein
MLRNISIGGKAFTLELTSVDEAGNVRFSLDGAERNASALEVMPRVWSVLIDGRSFEVRVLEENGDVLVEIDGKRYPVAIEDPRRHRRPVAAAGGEGRASVTAPMPGKVVRVLASEGDGVAAGQGLVVIEAMKMQNELKAPRAGRLIRLAVSQGETVAAGAVLAVVE